MSAPNWSLLASANNARRDQEVRRPQSLVLKNVHVFDGERDIGSEDIYFRDGRIVEPYDEADELDCSDKYLIPGLIDAHTHPITIQDLEALTKAGVTTTMSMAGFDTGHMASLKGHVGLVDVLVAGLPAAGPDNHHTKNIPGWPVDEILTTTSQAEPFVDKQIAKGADYIKILADVPGLDEDVLAALVSAARRRNKLTICHAAGLKPAGQALRARAHQLHHSPVDGIFSHDALDLYKQSGSIVCPTLSMMESVTTNLKIPGWTLENAIENVRLLHKIGVTILCGTDSNTQPGAPAQVQFGSSIHHELSLLVQSGLSNLEALRSATSLPARFFGLRDRGTIKVGQRADLILLSRNPVEDIRATERIEKVWINGILSA